MMDDTIIIRLLLLGLIVFSFWKSRHWLKNYWKTWKIQFKTAWEGKNDDYKNDLELDSSKNKE